MLQSHCCRTHGAADGDASQLRVTTLAHAELPDRQAYILFNYVQSLAICEFNKTGQVSHFPAAHGCSPSLSCLFSLQVPAYACTASLLWLHRGTCRPHT